MPEPKDEEPPSTSLLLIGVVGPCASGKTTLTAGLNQRGYRTRHIAQEHSYVKDMWQRLTNPDILIFLDASYPMTCQRRRLDWTEAEYAEQHRRLAHAREHADLLVNTDRLSAQEVLEQVILFIETRQQKG
jgi:deoxyadenosine/deoxycytidine kinase